ncbi:MAG: mechanosensitive ion channel family protein [Gemmatimonadales bacterium]
MPADLTREQIDDLVARLSDEAVRQILLDQLQKSAAASSAQQDSVTVMDRLTNGLDNAKRRMAEALGAMGNVVWVPGRIWNGMTEGSNTSPWTALFKIFVIFAIGLIVEKLFQRAMGNESKWSSRSSPALLRTRLKASLEYAVVEGLNIVVFAFASVLAWYAVGLPTAHANLVFTSLLTVVLAWRLVAVLVRMVLRPNVSWMRPVNLDDRTASHGYVKLMVLAGAVALLLWWPGELMSEFGIHPATREAAALITSILFIAIVVIMIWQQRPGESEAAGEPPTQDYFARNWHILAIIGTLAIYVVAIGVHMATGARTLSPAIASLILLGFMPIFDQGLRGLVHLYLDPENKPGAADATELSSAEAHPDSESEPGSDIEEAKTESEADTGSVSYAAVALRNGRILLALVAIVILGEIWDLDLNGLVQAFLGERITKVLINFSVTALLAYALWGIVSTAVARMAESAPGGPTPGDEGTGEGSRIHTLLPLFRKFLLVTLIVMLVMIFLSSMGVDIGPLIAGAGVVGIAIGFGAQTLVRDIVSGLFFLLDDAFRIGEYVTIGNDIRGTVERISVRSLRLRHHNGPLHTVPFGEIQTLTNWSRDWAIMKFDIRVPFETDIDKVRKIIKKVGQKLLQDPELGPLFLEPLKSQGVNRMDDSSFIIRCKFTSLPGQQWYLRRHAFTGIQEAFEAQGIKFAPRRVIVETASPNIPPDVAAGAAAAAEKSQQKPPGDEPG